MKPGRLPWCGALLLLAFSFAAAGGEGAADNANSGAGTPTQQGWQAVSQSRWSGVDGQRSQRGSAPAPRSAAPGDGGGIGGAPDLTDTDGWLRRQREESRRQRERIDHIYERQLCVDPDTGERYYAPETVTCP